MNSAAPIARSNRPSPQASYGQDPRPGDGSPIGRVVALVRRAVPTQSRADTLGWLIAWFILVAIAVQVAWIVIFNLQLGWWPAYDTHAYWLADGPWCVRPFWDRYLVTGDVDFLRNAVSITERAAASTASQLTPGRTNAHAASCASCRTA